MLSKTKTAVNEQTFGHPKTGHPPLDTPHGVPVVVRPIGQLLIWQRIKKGITHLTLPTIPVVSRKQPNAKKGKAFAFPFYIPRPNRQETKI